MFDDIRWQRHLSSLKPLVSKRQCIMFYSFDDCARVIKFQELPFQTPKLRFQIPELRFRKPELRLQMPKVSFQMP